MVFREGLACRSCANGDVQFYHTELTVEGGFRPKFGRIRRVHRLEMHQEFDYTFVCGSEHAFGYSFGYTFEYTSNYTFDNYTGEIIDDPLR